MKINSTKWVKNATEILRKLRVKIRVNQYSSIIFIIHSYIHKKYNINCVELKASLTEPILGCSSEDTILSFSQLSFSQLKQWRCLSVHCPQTKLATARLTKRPIFTIQLQFSIQTKLGSSCTMYNRSHERAKISILQSLIFIIQSSDQTYYINFN